MKELPTPLVDTLAKMMPIADKINHRLVFMGQTAEVVSAEEARQLERDRHELIEALQSAALVYKLQIIREGHEPKLKAGWVELEQQTSSLLERLK